MKIPSTDSGIKNLAKKQFAKKKRQERLTASYLEGDAQEKVWDNYQLTKELKREFKKVCSENNIVASKYLRSCIRLLIKKKGDIKKALKAVEKLDSSKLKD